MTDPLILVVDDEPNSLFGICQILTDEGYKVIPAESSRVALKKLETDPVNIVVTDVRMSDLDHRNRLLRIVIGLRLQHAL